MNNPPDALNLLDDLVRKAMTAGATHVDAMQIGAVSHSVSWLDGKVESLDRSESTDLGLRVFIGKKLAVVSTSDLRHETLEAMIERAIDMARQAPEDVFCGIAEAQDIAKHFPDLDMADDQTASSEELIAWAREAEGAAMNVKGVTRCSDISAGAGMGDVAYVASNGFAGSYRRTSFGCSLSALAGSGTEMERDYDYASVLFKDDMTSPSLIGQRAGQRAVRHLGGRKMATQKVPVVFDPRVAASLLGHLAGAINGASIARGTSFLVDKMDQIILNPSLSLIDDPLRRRGLRSRVFDAEGLAPEMRKIVDNGVLTTWFLDLRSARQLGLQSTAHASRSAGGNPSPSPSNLCLTGGTGSAQDLIGNIKNGLYLTDLMGMGVNGVTGDYSRAATGYWIENGVVTYPVNEITIAGNLKDMFRHMTAADDLEIKYGIDSPTLCIEQMTLGGI